MRFILTAVVLCAATPAWATTFENVTWLHCYDGDTCTFTLPGIHPFFGEKISVRIRGIDTPEIRGQCEAEKRKAKAQGVVVFQELKEMLEDPAGKDHALSPPRPPHAFLLFSPLAPNGARPRAAFLLRLCGQAAIGCSERPATGMPIT